MQKLAGERLKSGITLIFETYHHYTGTASDSETPKKGDFERRAESGGCFRGPKVIPDFLSPLEGSRSGLWLFPRIPSSPAVAGEDGILG
jgi:hypothetical protein